MGAHYFLLLREKKLLQISWGSKGFTGVYIWLNGFGKWDPKSQITFRTLYPSKFASKCAKIAFQVIDEAKNLLGLNRAHYFFILRKKKLLEISWGLKSA